jgi:hypothetical protein
LNDDHWEAVESPPELAAHGAANAARAFDMITSAKATVIPTSDTLLHCTYRSGDRRMPTFE